MNKTLNNVNKTAFHVFDETVGKVLNNQYVSHGLKIALVLYCAFMADKLPEEVSNVLQYSLVRLLIVLCIAYSAHHDPVLAIVLSIAFVVSVQNLNHMKVEKINNENFYDNEHDNQDHKHEEHHKTEKHHKDGEHHEHAENHEHAEHHKHESTID